MGWARWWGKRKNKTAAEAVPQVQGPTIFEKREALLALSGKLSCGIGTIAEEVVQATDHPERYVELWGDRLINRGIEEPIPDLAWIALVDALDEQGLVREIDWKQDADNILFAVHSLLDRRGWLQPAAERGLEQAISPGGYTFDHLRELHEWLRPHGIVLGHLDINSDSYVLIVVQEDQCEEIERLAETSGHKFYGSFQ
ncbi:DUF6630 family protein [Paenibacillus contaminans]|uniref:DUF6630 domain-containing protein n=1 Tax=Paenibacillus contaminans TaxID=450362 RepID=A0A329M3P6_9BACL|nr:DUF6630 family protein [Paenibacillus contaminans]RAV14815.1 hypothetical protein DQG23_30755 [Paenibacillus contaminans]